MLTNKNMSLYVVSRDGGEGLRKSSRKRTEYDELKALSFQKESVFKQNKIAL